MRLRLFWISALVGSIILGACSNNTDGNANGTAGNADGGGIDSGTSLDGGTISDGGGVLRNCTGPITNVTVVKADAFGVEWLPDRSRIAFNQEDANGFFHIYTMLADGGDITTVGESNLNFPQKTTGSVHYHPSGKYFLFEAEKSDAGAGQTHGATPGLGVDDDVWLATADASQVWQITDEPSDGTSGTIIPVFSSDGKHVMWTEKVAPDAGQTCTITGCWQLKIGDFVDDIGLGAGMIQNVKDVAPSINGYAPTSSFNESGGFSLDGTAFVFTSSYSTHNFLESQIIKMDVATLTPINLTAGTHQQNGTSVTYNEHPRYTPDGRITWMTDQGTDLDAGYYGTDWWIMNADGSNKTQLSFFNQPGNVLDGGLAVYPGPIGPENWSADATSFYGDIEFKTDGSSAEIVRVDLTCP